MSCATPHFSISLHLIACAEIYCSSKNPYNNDPQDISTCQMSYGINKIVLWDNGMRKRTTLSRMICNIGSRDNSLVQISDWLLFGYFRTFLMRLAEKCLKNSYKSSKRRRKATDLSNNSRLVGKQPTNQKTVEKQPYFVPKQSTVRLYGKLP